MSRIGSDVLKKGETINQSLPFRMGYSTNKVYSALKQNNDKLLNINQLAKMSGVSWPTVRNALAELMRLGLVEEYRVGNMIRYKLKGGL
jgi:DNA-binding transcriptional ArsR family regulator